MKMEALTMILTIIVWVPVLMVFLLALRPLDLVLPAPTTSTAHPIPSNPRPIACTSGAEWHNRKETL